MAWDTLKESVLSDLAQLIDHRGEEAHRGQLHLLAKTFYGRFAAEDMRGRSVENIYGCLYGLLHFLQKSSGDEPKVRIFNPELGSHGWESKNTVIALLCRDMPFCTSSVRGELNRRGIRVHVVSSCNLVTTRNKKGELKDILEANGESKAKNLSKVSKESLVYFEIVRHSDLESLEPLRETLADIIREVGVVVGDFKPMLDRLDDCADIISQSDCVAEDFRSEALEFVRWLSHLHITFLGYEYAQVSRTGSVLSISVDDNRSLGLLRHRNTSSVRDLTSDLESMSREQLHRKQLSFSKSRVRSRVHRLAYPDYVEVKEYDKQGEVVGLHRFMGLYTFNVYSMSPDLIPILRRKVAQVMKMSDLDGSEHDGRELARVLETFPRDELFQSSIDELHETVQSVNRIQERPQTRLFIRKDIHGKFFNCLVYIPRDSYSTELRMVIQNILVNALGAEEAEFTTQFSESILVRCHFVLRVNPSDETQFELNEIEEHIVQATLSWEDRLRIRLIEEFGEEGGENYVRDIGQGFPPGYRDDFDPRIAVLDIKKFQVLLDGQEVAMSLYRVLEEGDDRLRLRLYRRGESLPLSDILPIMENLGLRVVTERPYAVRAASGDRYWVQEFSLIYALSNDIDLDQVKDEFEDAFARIWFGEAESDSFNRLLLGTRLTWREIALLRAYARYLRQVRFPYSADYIAETMANHLHLTGYLVELFLTRFSPAFDGDEEWRAQRESAIVQSITDGLEGVQNLGEDRIVRQFLAVIKATVRTNFFQEGEGGALKPYFSFKLFPADIPDIPQPVPMFEIFVYSPRVEGVHLRGGKVARGGLRWSDRAEDFRTEVLGLVKAQQVKNAVIVPVGAKGGFVAKKMTANMTRDEVQQEGIACYKLFIRGLLDITDNRTEGGVVRPHLVVVKDDEDPYLVVAADKGTATFSDIANDISAEYKFWLGDAFASGGSVGYDHKKMAITARGAWVSVQRHFREMSIDVQTTDFTVVGIGDMAGDVFGNGMLLSEHIKLLAAFNHLHIFVDPNPDAAASFVERKRLFELPRSSWSDYEAKLISEGGGVFERSAKSIAISAEMKTCFDITEDRLTPNDLISYILKSRVDLLWNGGIGTYVKATTETDMDVGDKANDSLRLNANELRCGVIGEGGNLGMTQLARVEYGLNGGRSNTDFIDNAGGVDCSDHEVNIKILLNAVMARGDLTQKHRNALLEEMTTSVSELVLKNNYRQVQAISITENQAEARSGEYRRFITKMENSGRLNRALEFLPSDEVLADRKAQGKALTRPELSVLVSYSKAILKEELIESDLGLDPHLANVVKTAFPDRLLEEYEEEILGHQLQREIMCTQTANDIVNRMGLNFVDRQRKATGAPVADVARAYTTVMNVFSVAQLWDDIETLDHQVESCAQMDMMLELIRLVKRSVRWMLRNRRHDLAPTKSIAEFGEGLAQLREVLMPMLSGRAAESYQSGLKKYTSAGVPEELASAVASSAQLYKALGIIQAASETDADLLEVAQVYFLQGERLELDWFSGQINAAKVENEWQALARDTYMEDLEWQQRTLSIGALRHVCEKRDIVACLERWEALEETLINRWKEMLTELHATDSPDFAMYAVANRELLDLAQSSMVD
ncbi:MAG: NAD-glutamate dehydrogenase [Halioglobus sp.]